jgi:hypothetical protein
MILLFLVNTRNGRLVFFSKRVLLVFTGFYVILTVVGLFFRGERWTWITPGQADYAYAVLTDFKTARVNFSPGFGLDDVLNSPEVQGRSESCLVCHSNMRGLVKAHQPEAIGCFSCHSGNPFATDKAQAHRNMIPVPGNLSNAKQSCGTTQCHPDIVNRVSTGLMATLSGMISVDRFVFNEQNTPDKLTNVHQLGNSAADEHLKNLCVQCHLGNPKTEYGPANESSRGGGCLACHLNYSPEAENELAQNRDSIRKFHPSVSLQVSDHHCFGCHSRSGRISTNYEGWHETTLEASQMPDSSNYRLVEGSRVFRKETEDVHHKLGLECIDCHHSYELMGDGKFYAHEEDQQDVSCADCHFNGKPLTVSLDGLDNESAIIVSLRYGNVSNREFLKTHKHGHALINTSVEKDSVYFLSKNKRLKMALKPPARVCTRGDAHAELSCNSCHSSWAPGCIGCHNAYDPNEPGYDMVRNVEKRGSWVEFSGSFAALRPALGVREKGGKKEIIPVVPGMVLTIDKKSFAPATGETAIFHRLFAPVAPHTTAARGRDCISCHNNPVALGFGQGELIYQTQAGQGKWTFRPLYENDLHDGLPGDAWTGFLENRTGTVSTRTDVKPFDAAEQKKILRVGACLTCHDQKSKVMDQALVNFERTLSRRSRKCVLPDSN